MAYFFSEPSRTFSEYLLVPGYSSAECIPANVSLKTPVVKYRRGEEPALTMNVPMVSAVMQAVSGEQMGIALAKEGGIAFIYVSQPIEQQAEMVRRVKNYKAGFVISDSNLRLGDTLADVLALKERTGHSTMAVTDDGTGTGKLLGLVTSRDYRVSRMDPATPVSEFMTPAEKIVSAPEGTSLKAANDIIWDHKLNALPIVSAGGHLVSFVFRKDYDSHKGNPLELLDSQKRYVVGAGINSRDYEERVPALVEAGADVLVIDSSEGYSEWQKRTLAWIGLSYMVILVALTTYYFFTGTTLGNLGPLLTVPGLIGLGAVSIVSWRSTGRPGKVPAILLAVMCWALALATLPIGIAGLLSNFGG